MARNQSSPHATATQCCTHTIYDVIAIYSFFRKQQYFICFRIWRREFLRVLATEKPIRNNKIYSSVKQFFHLYSLRQDSNHVTMWLSSECSLIESCYLCSITDKINSIPHGLPNAFPHTHTTHTLESICVSVRQSRRTRCRRNECVLLAATTNEAFQREGEKAGDLHSTADGRRQQKQQRQQQHTIPQIDPNRAN